VAKKLVVFHHDKVEFFQQGYEDFLQKIGWDEELPASPAKTVDRPNRQELKRLRSEMIIDRGRATNFLKKKMENLEKEIIKLEEEEKGLEATLIDLAATGDSKKIQESSQRLGIVKKRVEEAFEELTDVTIQHDEIYQSYEERLKELEA
jgi:ATP-binding cassette subfamily F protein 3